jgi:hypothetical protein
MTPLKTIGTMVVFVLLSTILTVVFDFLTLQDKHLKIRTMSVKNKCYLHLLLNMLVMIN